ncbi:MAG: DUF1499 domain-containing protein [Candidatus Poseidoniales archaeon]|jgi:uncharacterized protein (DUF1499 family)|tara:strand:- start:2451 stop:2951 length:501 start_codon:yes stop_codon:yes gene_type:complete
MEFSPRQKKATMLVFLLCSPWLLCQAWIAVGAPDEAFTSMPVCSENSGNCAHLGGDAMYRMDGDYTLILNQSSDQVWDKVQQYIDESGSDILFEEKNESGDSYTHFVERTSFWRFPDDISVLISPLSDDTCSLELHSQSRLGQGDLGVNPKRLENLYATLIGQSVA